MTASGDTGSYHDNQDERGFVSREQLLDAAGLDKARVLGEVRLAQPNGMARFWLAFTMSAHWCVHPTRCAQVARFGSEELHECPPAFRADREFMER